MPTFVCRTRDAAGAVVEKTIQAASRREALSALERSGLFAVSIEERDAARGGAPARTPSAGAGARGLQDRASSAEATRHRLSRRERMQFSLQLGSSLRAGVPILAALRGMNTDAASPPLRAILTDLSSDLEGGLALSEAMRRHPRAFAPVYVGTIEAGESSSTLDDMLDNLAEYIEAEMELVSDVRSALLYPAIVMSTLGLAVTVLIVFIVPRFATFYDGFDAELPLATRILVGFSELLSEHFVLLAVGAVGALYGLTQAFRTEVVRQRTDRLLLRVPLLGKVVHTALTLHVVQMLGLFTRAGVPILDGLRTIASTVSNRKLNADLVQVTSGIAVGDSLAAGLDSTGCFPDAARQMLSNGESSGTLERACSAVSQHYKKELRYLTKNTATFIEPLMTLVLAVVVLFVALAAFLPMWDMVKVVGR